MPGVVRDGVLEAGERHVYLLVSEREVSDRTLRVRVEQRGVDLVLDLVGPAGEARWTIDSPSGRRGEERLLVSAAAGDPPRVAVRSLGRDAGAYRLRFEVAREVTEHDRRRLEAERRTMVADHTYALGDGPSRRRALDRYVLALGAWRRLGAEPEVARSLTHIGILQRQADDLAAARGALEEALVRWRRAGERHQQARVLNELGFIHDRHGDGEQALTRYRQALALWQALDDPRGEATTRNNVGLYHHRQGAPRAAGGHYREALRLFRRVGDARRAALVLVNLGGVADLLGEPEAALARYEEALDALRELDRPRDEARVLGNIAVVLRGVGRYQEAIDRYREALVVQRRIGARADQARTLSNLGALDLTLGRSAAARDALEQALALRRELGDRRGEAYTLGHLGDVSRRREDPGAEAYYQRALALHRSVEDRRGEAQTLADLGGLLGERRRIGTARERLERALRLAREVADPGLECVVAWRLGVLDATAGDAAAGLVRLGRALRLARDSGRRGEELGILIALTEVHRDGGDHDRAEERIAEALAMLESLRAGVASPELRASFVAQRHRAYELAVDLALARHQRTPSARHELRAFALAERSRARGLLDLVQEAGVRLGNATDPALAARRARVVERLALKSQRHRDQAARDADGAGTRALAREIAAILRQLDEIDDAIRRESPRWHALIRPQPLDAAGARALLDPGILLLVYALGGARSFLFALTADGLESHQLPPRTEIETDVRDLLAAWRVRDIGGGRDQDRLARQVGEALLGPVRDRLDGARLAVVADGALHHLPFAALPRPGSGEPLVVTHEVVHLPSVSVLGLQRALVAGRSPASSAVAVLADPVFDRFDPRFAGAGELPAAARGAVRDPGDPGLGLTRLPFSQDEAAAIARLVPAADRLIAQGFDATFDLVADGRLRDFRVVHLATHGMIDPERPALSGLMLAGIDRRGETRQSFLSLPAIYGLDLRADLVVLSGCRTALGEALRGEGLWGLVQGFFHAGAARVVASLWQVEDRATAELMHRFYAAHLGREVAPASALAQAQRSLLGDRRWADPYHWAPFVLYGDWR